MSKPCFGSSFSVLTFTQLGFQDFWEEEAVPQPDCADLSGSVGFSGFVGGSWGSCPKRRLNFGCLVRSRFCCFFWPEQSAIRCISLFTVSLCRLQWRLLCAAGDQKNFDSVAWNSCWTSLCFLDTFDRILTLFDLQLLRDTLVLVCCVCMSSLYFSVCVHGLFGSSVPVRLLGSHHVFRSGFLLLDARFVVFLGLLDDGRPLRDLRKFFTLQLPAFRDEGLVVACVVGFRFFAGWLHLVGVALGCWFLSRVGFLFCVVLVPCFVCRHAPDRMNFASPPLIRPPTSRCIRFCSFFSFLLTWATRAQTAAQRRYKKSDADEPRPRLWKNDRKTVQCFFGSHFHHRFALCGSRCEEKTSAIYLSARFVFVKI